MHVRLPQHYRRDGVINTTTQPISMKVESLIHKDTLKWIKITLQTYQHLDKVESEDKVHVYSAYLRWLNYFFQRIECLWYKQD